MDVAEPLPEARSRGYGVWSESLLAEAILRTVGERGLVEVSTGELAARTGLGEGRFEHRFGGTDAAYDWAYDGAVERIYRDVREACSRVTNWRARFEAALARVLSFVAAQPQVAKALLVEVRAAPDGVRTKRQELTEHLLGLLAAARHEPGGRASTPATAGLVLGAIEESLRGELVSDRGARVERLLPGLTYLAFLQLFDEAC